MDTQQEKEKAVHELTRLKQHLLEKEAEESEKIDEDIKTIEDLRQSNDYLRAQVSNLERTLKQAVLSQEELKMANNSEVLKSREIIDDLDKKLSNCIGTIDAKNHELLNLQTALGQYYAKIEAKEHLERELVRAREETTRLTQLLRISELVVSDLVTRRLNFYFHDQDAENKVDVSRIENEKVLAQLAHSEKVQTEWRSRVVKLEEDNSKVRRALEQSMVQLNRMSLDSDYLVDKGKQLDAIQAVLSGRDCFCLMPTGGGKSMCYQIPTLAKTGIVLVVCPLIALMLGLCSFVLSACQENQVMALKEKGIDAEFLSSTISSSTQQIPDGTIEINAAMLGCFETHILDSGDIGFAVKGADRLLRHLHAKGVPITLATGSHK
ncbi:hypothetical protein AHAS_Ahas09G0158600 [Arachis hypogaea]